MIHFAPWCSIILFVALSHGLITLLPVGVQSIICLCVRPSICLFVCLSVCLCYYYYYYLLAYLKNRMSKFHQIFCTCGCGSVLHWHQCYTLCTSGFVDDVMFSYNAGNRPELKTVCMFRPVRQVVPPVWRQTMLFGERSPAGVIRSKVCHLWLHFV